MGLLDGKVAVVTGGASGIGLATARRFAAEGASVVIADRTAEAGELAAKEIDGRFVFGDVGEPDTWDDIVGTAQSAFGGLDIAYLNAGVTTGEGSIAALTDKQYRRIMRVNVDGVVFGARAVIPAIASRGGGAIIATSSLAGLIAFPPDPIYNLTKHAVVGFVRGLAPQLEPQSITVNCVCPGIVATGLVGVEAKERLEAAGFVLIDPADIAAAVLNCATGTATGQAVVCQAGREPVAYRFHDVPGPRRGEARDWRALSNDE
jgi:NAD(P)-dependent dehydrogenase (short-subunit alcohol dehydrogenase family)